MDKYLTSLSIFAFSLMPFITYAAKPCPKPPGNLKDVICMATELVNPIIGLITGLGVIYFLWNVINFIGKAEEPKERSKYKDGMFYGVAGLFVLFSFWGLVELLRASVFG